MSTMPVPRENEPVGDEVLEAEARSAQDTKIKIPAESLFAVIGEFADVPSAVAAAREVRDAGFTRFDLHSPFPIHGVERAIGIRPTVLPWIVLGGGVSGCILGLLLVWFTNVEKYPFLISGKPIFSLPANIPIIFETTVLFAAFAAVFGMFFLNKLPLLYTPLFKSSRFRRVTSDRFLLVIEASDRRFSREDVHRLLESLGALSIEEVEE